MRKIVKDSYIVALSETMGQEITDEEYNLILSVIFSCPSAEGKGHRLRTDLTWEEYDLPVSDEPHIYTDEELSAMTNAELAEICAGYGFAGSMNKSVMVYLILHAQNESNF